MTTQQHKNRVPVLVVMAFAISLLCAACGQPDRETRMVRVQALMNEGSYLAARIELMNLAKNDREDVDAHYLLARVLLGLGDPESANFYYQNVIGLGTAEEESNLLGAEIGLALGKFAELRQALEQGELSDMKEPERGLYLAEAMLGEGNHVGAESLLRSLAERHSDRVEVREAFARSLGTQGELEKSLEQIKEVNRIFPDYAPGWSTKGQLFLRRAEFDEAAESFETALLLIGPEKEYRQFVGALVGLLDAQIGSNRPEAAGETVQRIAAAAPGSPFANLARAKFALMEGDPDEAVSQLNELIRTYPSDAQAHALLGSIHASQGNLELAETYLQQAVQIDPSTNRAKLGLLALYLARADYRRARPLMEEMLALEPAWIRGIVLKALMETRDGNTGEGLALADNLREFFPEGPEPYVMQGDVFFATGYFEEAAIAYNRALDLDSSQAVVLKAFMAAREADQVDPTIPLADWLEENEDDLLIRFGLAQYQQSTDQHEQAVDNYRYLLNKAPQNAVVLNNLAWSYYKLGDDRALNYASEAYGVMPENGSIADTYGWLLVESGDIQGVGILEQANSLSPENPEIKYHLAVGLVGQGQTMRAKTILIELLDSNADFGSRDAAENLVAELN